MQAIRHILIGILVFTINASAAQICEPSLTGRKPSLGTRAAATALRGILSRRYNVTVRGLKEVEAKGSGGIIFLFEHPAMIDPLILFSQIGGIFSPRPLITERQLKNPGLGLIAKASNALLVPDAENDRANSSARVNKMIDDVMEGLAKGDNFMIAPAGQIKRSRNEEIGANSLVHSILQRNPNVRIVIVKSRGIWGSRFSFGFTGDSPSAKKLISSQSITTLLPGGPKREVTLDFVEPQNLPRTGTRLEVNAFLENQYNTGNSPNTYVPLSKNGKTMVVPEPVSPHAEALSDNAEVSRPLSEIPATIKQTAIASVAKVAKLKVTEINENSELEAELGLDSLSTMEVLVELESALGAEVPQTAAQLKTVADLIHLADLSVRIKEKPELKKAVQNGTMIRPDPRWFLTVKPGLAKVPDGKNILDVILTKARENPDQVIIADGTSGGLTYRELMLGVFMVSPRIKAIKGNHIGIMMPTSVGGTLLYISTLMAGKIPVMINPTVGEAILKQSIEIGEVDTIFTSSQFVEKLASKGISVEGVEDKFMYIEAIKNSIASSEGKSAGEKLASLVRVLRSGVTMSWRTVPWRHNRYSVMLFTSGSSGVPKAVPLTHENQLTNIRDAIQSFEIRADDRLMGLLPSFHSFGNTGIQVLALCAGIPTVYFPDPSDGKAIAENIGAYKPTLILGTPDFLRNIFSRGTPEQLQSIRIAMTGASRLTTDTANLILSKNPKLKLIEGYGTTEASPIVSVNPPDAPKLGTVGKLLPSLTAKVIDPATKQEVRPGEPGELVISGPSIFEGYYKNQADPFIVLDGKKYYRTGDEVVIDSEGYIRIVGRFSRQFKGPGGEMVNMQMIEDGLLDQSVFKKNSDSVGPALAVEVFENGDERHAVLFSTIPIDLSEVNRIQRDLLKEASTWWIKEVIFVDAIPMLGTGKPDYKVLKNQLKARLGQ